MYIADSDDGDDDALEHADERDAERARDGQRELGLADRVEAAQLRDVEQADATPR